MIVIIGGGLGGLTAARTLLDAGCDDFVLLEKSPVMGGRLRTERTADGFLLDAGFQIVLDSYPALRRFGLLEHLERHGAAAFESGALMWEDGHFWELDHPVFTDKTGAVLRTAGTSAITVLDKIRLSALAFALLRTPDASLLSTTAARRDISTRQYLRELGFSSKAMRRFFQPFFGGVFLEDQLDTSASLFRYYLKKFVVGRALLPMRGIADLAEVLAAPLPSAVLRKSTAVRELIWDGRNVTGVRLENGEELAAQQVILATDATTAAELLRAQVTKPPTWRGVTSVYFKSREPVTLAKKLILPAGGSRLVRHFCVPSNVQPSWAPEGWSLLHATVLNRTQGTAHSGETGVDLTEDAAFFDAVRDEIETIFPGAACKLEPLAIRSIRQAVPVQGPGFGLDRAQWKARIPDQITLAGDVAGVASIQTVMESGVAAAGEALLRTA